MNNVTKPSPRLKTPTDLGANATKDLAGALNALLADNFALYMKTNNRRTCWPSSATITNA
jgi:hypothetical protein